MALVITPEGDLINTAAIKFISIEEGTVHLRYLDGTHYRYELDCAWKNFLKELAQKGLTTDERTQDC